MRRSVKKKKVYNIDSTWKKVWYFIWEDDSVWSWIVNIVLAFILMKFLVYPGLGLMFGTTHPIVAVVSGSMEHKIVELPEEYSNNNGLYEMCGTLFKSKSSVDLEKYWAICGSWYSSVNVTLDQFREFPYKNGFNTGDIMILWGKRPKDIDVGDVIVYQGSRADPIIHRAVQKWEKDDEYFFKAKGDHNRDSNHDEFEISSDRLIALLYPNF